MSECRYQAEPRGAFGLAGGWCSTHNEGWDWCLKRTRAQLAQREAELEALRERVDEWEVFGEFAMEGAAKSFLRGIRPAALSDNQEPDALTYDEIVELAKTNPGLERFYGVDLDDDDLPDNQESPTLTDKEA